MTRRLEIRNPNAKKPELRTIVWFWDANANEIRDGVVTFTYQETNDRAAANVFNPNEGTHTSVPADALFPSETELRTAITYARRERTKAYAAELNSVEAIVRALFTRIAENGVRTPEDEAFLTAIQRQTYKLLNMSL